MSVSASPLVSRAAGASALLHGQPRLLPPEPLTIRLRDADRQDGADHQPKPPPSVGRWRHSHRVVPDVVGETHCGAPAPTVRLNLPGDSGRRASTSRENTSEPVENGESSTASGPQLRNRPLRPRP